MQGPRGRDNLVYFCAPRFDENSKLLLGLKFILPFIDRDHWIDVDAGRQPGRNEHLAYAARRSFVREGRIDKDEFVLIHVSALHRQLSGPMHREATGLLAAPPDFLPQSQDDRIDKKQRRSFRIAPRLVTSLPLK